MQIKHHFHLIGINGIGMSGIAKILYKQGHVISGCDLAHTHNNIKELIQAGCSVSRHHGSSICHDLSISRVVYSSDIPYDHEELQRARSLNISIVPRAQILADIMLNKNGIAITGSHGKTTTSSMISHIFLQANLQPTIIIGGIMHSINNNALYGTGDHVIVEADESDKSHLLLKKHTAVVTNIDFEHVTTYKSLDEIRLTFLQFINQLPKTGIAIVCSDDENILKILPETSSAFFTYGTTDQADFQAINIVLKENDSYFEIFDQKNKIILGSIKLPMPGIYNVLNATAAIATALQHTIPFKIAAQALKLFEGIEQRFSYKGTLRHPRADVFDDYAHHPTEIYHCLMTARRKAKKKLIVIFQPQRYTRTYHLWNEFITVFKNADIDHLIITDIYAASEPVIENINALELVRQIKKNNQFKHIYYIPFDKKLDYIKKHLAEYIDGDDLILFLGAGKINVLIHTLFE